ncbi:MAG TPA: TolC family protein, partial [Candidatus Saccharimonadales bacterium]|nr:TolC family protein [Candidatus Saccharimonadales bacterium]
AGENESFLSRQLAAQSNVVRLLKDQFEAGAVSGYELTQARVTADSTRLAWQEAVGLRGEALAQMAATLGLPLDALDGAKFSFAVFDQFSTELTRPEARRRALLNRADVRGALADYAASQSALQLEIAKQYPDLHLGPGYAWNAGSAGDNEWNLGLTLTLPIMNHNQGAVAEAKARRAQAAAHFRTVQANAIAGINSAMAAYDAAMQLWSTARTLRENLRRRLNSVQELEQAGEAEPLTVANAQVEFGVSSQSQLAALIKTQRALGQLEDAVQSPLTLPPGLLRAAEKNPIR